MSEKITWLTVGKLVSPQGLKGQIRVNPSSDFPERFTKPGDRWLQKIEEKPRKLKLAFGKRLPGKSIYVVSFLGINNRSEAELLIGMKMLVPSNQRPLIAKNEFHLLDLIDLEVKLSLSNQSIGKVINLLSAGNDLLEIKPTNGKNILIPFVKEIVPEVNIEKGYIIISPPPGLLDL